MLLRLLVACAAVASGFAPPPRLAGRGATRVAATIEKFEAVDEPAADAAAPETAAASEVSAVGAAMRDAELAAAMTDAELDAATAPGPALPSAQREAATMVVEAATAVAADIPPLAAAPAVVAVAKAAAAAPAPAPARAPSLRQRVFGRVRRARVDAAAEALAAELLDEDCEVDTSAPVVAPSEECVDGSPARKGAIRRLAGLISSAVRGAPADDAGPDDGEGLTLGDELEAGWEARGKGSSLRRNAEVWKFFAKCGIKVLKARKGEAADKTAAAVFVRDGLLRLGPTFVKARALLSRARLGARARARAFDFCLASPRARALLTRGPPARASRPSHPPRARARPQLGQVLSTRTDVLSAEYIDVLKTLQDDVPPFAGAKAKRIVEAELGKPLDELFASFDEVPIAGASLGQVRSRARSRGAARRGSGDDAEAPPSSPSRCTARSRRAARPSRSRCSARG